MSDLTKQCTVCCEDFNNSKNKRITCPSCDVSVCRDCTRKYLLEKTETPHCMSCKVSWGREFYTNALLKSFVNKDYKEHRKKVMLEDLKSKLKDAMPAVSRHIKVQELSKEDEVIKNKISILGEKIYKLRVESGRINHAIRTIENGGDVDKERKTFIRPCADPNCRGFLSTAWKCGICKKYTCSKCLVLKDEPEDGEETKGHVHVCKEEDIKTAETIKSQTKPCPNCGICIEKADGCDQMWCTQCHQAFSWKSGLKVNGVIHNPHFFAWQNAGGVPARVAAPRAIMCGGIPEYNDFQRVVMRSLLIDRHAFTKDDKTKEEACGVRIIKMIRPALHFTHVELANIREKCNQQNNNEDLSIKYILKEIDDSEVMVELMKREKKSEKLMATLHIYEVINLVLTESLRDVYESIIRDATKDSQGNIIYPDGHTPFDIITRNIKRIEQIRIYSNNELKKISALYSQTVKLLRWDYSTYSEKISPKNLQQAVIPV